MGRKRLDPDKKRIKLTLSVPKNLVDTLKQENINISQLFENLVKDYLKRK